MSSTIESLQSLIDKKAENRLIKDLQEACNFIFNNRILGEGSRHAPQLYSKAGEKFTCDSLPSHLYISDRDNVKTFVGQLYAYWFPIYQAEEAKMFLEKVDQLRAEVDHLLDNQTNQ